MNNCVRILYNLTLYLCDDTDDKSNSTDEYKLIEDITKSVIIYRTCPDCGYKFSNIKCVCGYKYTPISNMNK